MNCRKSESAAGVDIFRPSGPGYDICADTVHDIEKRREES